MQQPLTRAEKYHARFMLHQSEMNLGGQNLELIDCWRDDFRDQIGDLIHRPDPEEESDFAPLRDERRFYR